MNTVEQDISYLTSETDTQAIPLHTAIAARIEYDSYWLGVQRATIEGGDIPSDSSLYLNIPEASQYIEAFLKDHDPEIIHEYTRRYLLRVIEDYNLEKSEMAGLLDVDLFIAHITESLIQRVQPLTVKLADYLIRSIRDAQTLAEAYNVSPSAIFLQENYWRELVRRNTTPDEETSKQHLKNELLSPDALATAYLDAMKASFIAQSEFTELIAPSLDDAQVTSVIVDQVFAPGIRESITNSLTKSEPISWQVHDAEIQRFWGIPQAA